jgi:protease PrsW
LALVKSRWFQIFIVGLILWGLADVTLRFTKDILYFPTIMVIGAFLIPITFVAFFFQQENILDRGIHKESILPTLVLCGLIGGLIGTLAAGLLESRTLSSNSPLSTVWVGLIEELSKLIVPVTVYVIMRKRFRSELDGLLFGVGTGMMFAALETMGYELISLVSSQGNINILDETILLRGLLSPAGHAAWTGLITATLWRERERTGKSFTLWVAVFFILSAALHSSWDFASATNSLTVLIVSYIAIAGVSLTLLLMRFRESRKLAIKAKAVVTAESQ